MTAAILAPAEPMGTVSAPNRSATNGTNSGWPGPAHHHAGAARGGARRRRAPGAQDQAHGGQRHGRPPPAPVDGQGDVHRPVLPTLGVLAGPVQRVDDPHPPGLRASTSDWSASSDRTRSPGNRSDSRAMSRRCDRRSPSWPTPCPSAAPPPSSTRTVPASSASSAAARCSVAQRPPVHCCPSPLVIARSCRSPVPGRGLSRRATSLPEHTRNSAPGSPAAGWPPEGP